MPRFVSILLLCASLTLALPALTRAQQPSTSPYPEPSIPANADAATATRAWLDTVPAPERARSNAYFEGGYWLLLWDFLLTSAICLFLLYSRASASLRNQAERMTRSKSLQVMLYAIPLVALTFVLQFPLSCYENYVREHAYGMANQTFGPWFAEQLKMLAISAIVTSILLVALYAVFRRAPRTWWIWSAGVFVLFAAFGAMISPIFIEPVFNKYKPLTDPKINEPILAMARANQIPVKQVFEVDASKQTKRVSANVAGMFGTARIALNDNLLRQCSLPEIRCVMAHEMGHYVLNHIYKLMLSLALSALLAFGLARLFFDAAVRRWGASWEVHGIADPAGAPLLLLIFTTLSFLFTPFGNTLVRTSEIEADAFGLNTSREADGMARASLKLGAYRKLDPSPIEEWIFFDHPSGRARIRMAMDWKAAHLPNGDGASVSR